MRPAIQIELNYAALRRPFFSLPVASFVAEAFGRSPEIPTVACVGVAETAAEKLVSLTRRTAMELAGVSRNPDPTLVWSPDSSFLVYRGAESGPSFPVLAATADGVPRGIPEIVLPRGARGFAFLPGGQNPADLEG